jgi:hypothetical protein
MTLGSNVTLPDDLVATMTKRELFSILVLLGLLANYDESEDLIVQAVELADELIETLNINRWN